MARQAAGQGVMGVWGKRGIVFHRTCLVGLPWHRRSSFFRLAAVAPMGLRQAFFGGTPTLGRSEIVAPVGIEGLVFWWLRLEDRILCSGASDGRRFALISIS